jgi:phosphate-selective porin OprO/OprP
MRYILLLLLITGLYAKSESCYTVQLTSAFNSQKNYDDLSSKSYDESCKVMRIGKSITVRCGCFDEYRDAKATLPRFKREYKKAYITSTYKYRFGIDAKENSVASLPLYKEPLKEKKVLKYKAKEPQKIQYVATKSTEQVVHKTQKIDIVEPKKKKHKKNKVKKKKKQKDKYVKKRKGVYFYDRYLKKLRNKDGIGKFDYRYKFGAQFSYDGAYINEAYQSYHNTHWRRIRVYHQGSFFDKKLFYEMEYSFTGNNHYKDNFIGYQDKIKPINTTFRIKTGNIKVPFSLESYSSSKNITFMERALTDSFGISRKVGAELLLSTKFANNRINMFASYFTNSIDERRDDEIDKPGYSARLTYAHKFSKRHILSIGAGYLYQDMKYQDVKLSQDSESYFMRDDYVSTKVKQVDDQKTLNLEALYIYNKYSLQAEYARTTLDAINYKKKKNPSGLVSPYTFDAYYIQGSYFLIGQGRKYKLSDSTLGKIKPSREGALEFALRYSYINLNDRDEEGGKQVDYNFGVNWYYNSELKFMLNYVNVNPENPEEYDGRLQIVQARALFAF